MLLTTLQGLAGQLVDGTRCTHLRLIRDHVTKTLVIYHANINISLQLIAPDTWVQRLTTIVVKACSLQLLTKIASFQASKRSSLVFSMYLLSIEGDSNHRSSIFLSFSETAFSREAYEWQQCRLREHYSLHTLMACVTLPSSTHSYTIHTQKVLQYL